MKLIIGGCTQGKLDYVLQKYDMDASKIWDGEIPKNIGEQKEPMVINHLHNWIKSQIAQGGCPEKEIRTIVEHYPDCVIISDEVGNGIVPTETFEREYRERTGRILVELAKKAEEVERVICGIGQKIK
ncbi:MAG: bifunctional adenosylcobinamide kinase/adenosylcobinamide-phosphate guanylyltransferase [Lachnospiraceae bacterium]|nr:bifunctional adenosylcobinamide kinase/adenosylcobinamide-phosphate guanylyltransferase [Lachnospiraceae bacterium]